MSSIPSLRVAAPFRESRTWIGVCQGMGREGHGRDGNGISGGGVGWACWRMIMAKRADQAMTVLM